MVFYFLRSRRRKNNTALDAESEKLHNKRLSPTSTLQNIAEKKKTGLVLDGFLVDVAVSVVVVR